MIVTLLLLMGVAQADGIVAVQSGQSVTPTELSYLLPEPYYDECLAKAGALGDVQGQLDACIEQSLLAIRDAQVEFDALEANYTELSDEYRVSEVQVDKLTRKVELVKRHRNMAIVGFAGTALVLSGVIALNIAL